MKKLVLIVGLALGLSGCALFEAGGKGRPGPVTGPSDAQPATEFAPAVASTALGARAVRAEALDTTTAAEKAAAHEAQADKPPAEKPATTQPAAKPPTDSGSAK